MSGIQPFGFVVVLTQGFALGWDVAAPLALSECGSRFPSGMTERNAKAKTNTVVRSLRSG